ncbi:MAG: hypothetical protein UU73_C0003G0041 [Candidatus Daviesbacteria bacterium GW2011_GWA1_41_61]|uniref:Cytidyltransferase-like domain-containing protein n=1 Tax=Candidatus Daviesbacteria bacterium GW2011_GWA2_40_9 TaxID=1618424 RepID=A0A0G0X6K0_9BACT|nr:MAG: hypothetical protein UU26_C0005G0015 [Candidatus Daviesbacteria bacterium GW2011_GWC1_40_9]KKR83262.1 MAG: hypothetical protein UU29_C0007G0132 [Candidatus Daviesbacteria bacterium GW2011_GWA2_40_9]KKR93607.1 MAG: hypothetical protein UU44_C0002G0268 [Candidatus Daviesbacteria bacterium GW2011_GWB1_41_15]KKS14842.1 MAG: hypothetical protein UU73_C0003G0041 [Candidatus Daviesbacteria bacterium GW2011_GWA1_41_61]
MSIELGTTLEVDQYRDPLLPTAERVIPIERLVGLLREAHGQYLVGATSGTFDLLHLGHLRYLERLAYEVYSRLGAGRKGLVVVGVNSDESTRRNKGGRTNGRPVMDERTRAEIVAGLRCVDLTFIFDDDLQLAQLHVDLFQVFTGSDHKPEDRPEVSLMKQSGTFIISVDPEEERPGATTDIIKKIREHNIY